MVKTLTKHFKTASSCCERCFPGFFKRRRNKACHFCLNSVTINASFEFTVNRRNLYGSKCNDTTLFFWSIVDNEDSIFGCSTFAIEWVSFSICGHTLIDPPISATVIGETILTHRMIFSFFNAM
ncbi:unnamed protein product [Schistosoma mattheei]|uniref:Uncharacterized protein n=1 Tax=Schistosoma mattheei TaxID=31246 RepID=A0A3P7Y900_9TREM|nr:unnamed protein product [Schistosoma mattheei]